MRRVACVLSMVCVLFSVSRLAAADMVGLELNTAESADTRCRLTFVIENKTERALDSFKLDLALFNPEGIIQRRMVIEMGPVRGQKTTVKTFSAEGDCSQVGAILINDVTACAPPDPGACLDGLTLNSRIKTIRLYK
jgi:hypothetical protein